MEHIHFLLLEINSMYCQSSFLYLTMAEYSRLQTEAATPLGIRTEGIQHRGLLQADASETPTGTLDNLAINQRGKMLPPIRRIDVAKLQSWGHLAESGTGVRIPRGLHMASGDTDQIQVLSEAQQQEGSPLLCLLLVAPPGPESRELI